MRKLFLFLFFLLPLVGSAGEPNDPYDIPLSDNECNQEDQRHDIGTTTFNAQIITNNLIKVQSTSITSFEVCIFDANDNTPHYQGYTINGILHITTNSLPAGQYILHIKGNGFKYFGNFVIAE